MPTRTRDLLIAVAVAGGVTLAAWLAAGRQPMGPTEPLGYVPATAAAVGYLRVTPVTESPLTRALFPAGTGAERMKELCGFNPTEGVRDMLVFAQGGDDALGPFGLVARGTLDRERLGECLQKLVAEGGGSTRITEMEGVPAVASGGGSSRAAFIGDDAVTVGDEDMVRDVLRAARGEARSAAAEGTLKDLWDRIARDRDVAVVAALPERWQRVAVGLARRQLGVTLDALPAVGLGADLGDGLQLGGLVRVGRPEVASRAVQQLQDRVERLRGEPIVAFSVLGTVLRRLKLAAEGPEIVLALKLDASHVDDLAELLSGARRPGSPEPSRGAGTPPGEPPAPDEVLRPGDEPPPAP